MQVGKEIVFSTCPIEDIGREFYSDFRSDVNFVGCKSCKMSNITLARVKMWLCRIPNIEF